VEPTAGGRIVFGQRVRTYREQRGWTLAELGRRIQMSKSSVSRIECGKQNVSIEDIEAIAAALEVSVGVLFAPGGPSPCAVSHARFTPEQSSGKDWTPLRRHLVLLAHQHVLLTCACASLDLVSITC
jgi:transcriptional regulator with XRE-family HTH domain